MSDRGLGAHILETALNKQSLEARTVWGKSKTKFMKPPQKTVKIIDSYADSMDVDGVWISGNPQPMWNNSDDPIIPKFFGDYYIDELTQDSLNDLQTLNTTTIDILQF